MRGSAWLAHGPTPGDINLVATGRAPDADITMLVIGVPGPCWMVLISKLKRSEPRQRLGESLTLLGWLRRQISKFSGRKDAPAQRSCRCLLYLVDFMLEKGQNEASLHEDFVYQIPSFRDLRWKREDRPGEGKRDIYISCYEYKTADYRTL